MTSVSVPLTPQELQALLDGPAAKPPSGVTSNLNTSSNLDGAFLAILTLCLLFATLCLILRMYTKSFIIRSIVLEDCE